MKESIKCCISCILPCGALDVIRIVHVSGRVEEISRNSMTARDIMNVYPKHVLRKPMTSSAYDEEASDSPPGTKSMILPPHAELQRGKIYFLMPVKEKENTGKQKKKKKKAVESSSNRGENIRNSNNNNNNEEDNMRLLVSDRYLSEIMKESKISSCHDKERRRGRVGVWRPHLPKIDEFVDDVI